MSCGARLVVHPALDLDKLEEFGQRRCFYCERLQGEHPIDFRNTVPEHMAFFLNLDVVKTERR